MYRIADDPYCTHDKSVMEKTSCWQEPQFLLLVLRRPDGSPSRHVLGGACLGLKGHINRYIDIEYNAVRSLISTPCEPTRGRRTVHQWVCLHHRTLVGPTQRTTLRYKLKDPQWNSNPILPIISAPFSMPGVPRQHIIHGHICVHIILAFIVFLNDSIISTRVWDDEGSKSAIRHM